MLPMLPKLPTPVVRVEICWPWPRRKWHRAINSRILCAERLHADAYGQRAHLYAHGIGQPTSKRAGSRPQHRRNVQGAHFALHNQSCSPSSRTPTAVVVRTATRLLPPPSLWSTPAAATHLPLHSPANCHARQWPFVSSSVRRA